MTHLRTVAALVLLCGCGGSIGGAGGDRVTGQDPLRHDELSASQAVVALVYDEGPDNSVFLSAVLRDSDGHRSQHPLGIFHGEVRPVATGPNELLRIRVAAGDSFHEVVYRVVGNRLTAFLELPEPAAETALQYPSEDDGPGMLPPLELGEGSLAPSEAWTVRR